MPEGFCEKCTGESTDEASGSFREGLFGHEFKGEARECPDCRSYVTVLWKVIAGFPAWHKGCFRYKMTGAHFGGTDFISRRVPDDPALIRRTRLTGILFMGAVIAAIAIFDYYKRRR